MQGYVVVQLTPNKEDWPSDTAPWIEVIPECYLKGYGQRMYCDMQVLEREPTWQELANRMDGNAEEQHYDHLVGTHLWLGGLISAHAGEQAAVDIMAEVLKCGGLHGLCTFASNG